jgi:hypothetical protein
MLFYYLIIAVADAIIAKGNAFNAIALIAVAIAIADVMVAIDILFVQYDFLNPKTAVTPARIAIGHAF